MISPLAYVDPEAKIGKNVTIQPFAYIEKGVEIGDDCIIMSYASILKGTKIGKGNKIHQNAVLGAEPQDFHYTGEESSLIIGEKNDIRENVVISRATFAGNATKIGNGNYLMDKVHLCHDVQLGNNCVVGIGTTIAGECVLDDCVIRKCYPPSILPYRKLDTRTKWLPYFERCTSIRNYVRKSGCLSRSKCRSLVTASQYVRENSPPHC